MAADRGKGPALLRARWSGWTTVTLKVKYADFEPIARSWTGAAPFAMRADLERQRVELFESLFPLAKGIRLLGASLSSLDVEHTKRTPQLSLAL